jgi:hypothetical protein
MPLLTQSERDFLLGHRAFTIDQTYYIKSRLIKKVKALFGTELPLLLDSAGLVVNGALAACGKDLAAGCKVPNAEIDQLFVADVQPHDSKKLVVQMRSLRQIGSIRHTISLSPPPRVEMRVAALAVDR